MKKWNEISTEEDIADSCEDAAALLEGHWGTGHWYDSGSEWDEDGVELDGTTWTYCIEGAMAAAVGLDAMEMDTDNSNGQERTRLVTCPVYNQVMETVNRRAEREGWEVQGYGEDDLPTWNDGPYGSEQAALDILHETAKRMRGVAP